MNRNETPVVCHSCEGNKYIWETHAFTKKEFKALCPECEGSGWVSVEAYSDE